MSGINKDKLNEAFESGSSTKKSQGFAPNQKQAKQQPSALSRVDNSKQAEQAALANKQLTDATIKSAIARNVHLVDTAEELGRQAMLYRQAQHATSNAQAIANGAYLATVEGLNATIEAFDIEATLGGIDDAGMALPGGSDLKMLGSSDFFGSLKK